MSETPDSVRIQTFLPAPLLSGADAKATQFSILPPFSFLKVLGQSGSYLFVFNPKTGGAAYVEAAKGEAVPKHVPGAMGTFGVAMRPDGSHQVTWNRRPLYTFSKDTPTKILCNGVQGWFVVKA